MSLVLLPAKGEQPTTPGFCSTAIRRKLGR